MSHHILYDLNPLIVFVINQNVSPISPIYSNWDHEGVLPLSISEP